MCCNRVEDIKNPTIGCDQLQFEDIMVEMEGNNSNSSINNDNDNILVSLVGSEENPRVKFLCSFGGSILPRPQDGKLRYVGGETRIVSVPRDICYEELMSRMRELYDGAAILKYQQPDEDLDALVSIVNDDDVTNMMEEYDKLGSGDGFTRLRIFLFSHPEQDLSPHYMDGDERDTERRYVDALNSLNESPDYRRSQFNDSPVMTPVDEVHIGDQFFSSMNLEGSVHSLRNYEMGMPQYNLRQLAIPSMGSGQNSAPFQQWYNDENPFSPAYFSPRCAGQHDTRAFSDFPSSPSSTHFRVPFQEMPDETNHPQLNNPIPPDHQRQYSDKVLWVPAGGVPVDRGGFPGNMVNTSHVHGGTSVCEHCKMNFHKNPLSSDFAWKPEEQSHVEQSAMRNALPQVVSRCAECLPNREAVLLNNDSRLLHGDRPLYNDAQTTERGWIVQNQLIQNDESRAYVSGIGRMGNQFTLDGTGAAVPVSGSNLPDGTFVPTTCTHIEDPRHIRAGAERGSDTFHGQSMAAASHLHTPLEEQRSVRTANMPYYYGPDVPHQVLHGHPSGQSMWRNAPTSGQAPPPYESSNVQARIDIPSGVVPRAPVEAGPRFFIGVDPSPWGAESSQRRLGVDGTAAPEHPYSQISKMNHVAPLEDIQPTFTQDPVRNQHTVLNIPSLAPESLRPLELPPMNVLTSTVRGYSAMPREDTVVKLDEKGIHGEAGESTRMRKVEPSDVDGIRPPLQNSAIDKNGTLTDLNPIDPKSIRSANGFNDVTQVEGAFTCPPEDNSDLTFLPELVASAKKAKLKSAEVVKARAKEDGDTGTLQRKSSKIAETDETDSPDVNGNSEGRSQDENTDSGKIELTKAEEEAIARGLQTIRNDDLEEVRELGSGTYGAVYHGKWKGSDVAIKRIKASCFAGRPSERERLIADFWKEALILSSLHHPNVVSFYGIVRDGPDGSLATVTEFMINGSLKQFLRKKDRTIDRRKRLIIAMDAAFGMEYLHGKNIVHFDLKCENLLVNMRDPHRPVCKIGDLGLSKVKQHTLVSGGVRGTLPWMAPELLSGKSNMVTEKIDVYSFGVVMWELLTGEEPYSEMHCASIIGGIVNNTLRPQIPSWCDPEWKSLMESCWAPDPSERPSFSEISQKLRSMAAAMNVK